MSLITEPKIFRQFPLVRAAMTTRGTGNPPYGFNMSLSVGDDGERVHAMRARLAERLGFAPERLASQRQVHGDTIGVVSDGHGADESDALITAGAGWLLAISVADCVPVLIHDPATMIVAGVHSGWRGTAKRIAAKTVGRLRDEFGSSPEDLHIYIGAAASGCCYEVGEDVAAAFDERYSRPIGNGKYLFDNKGAVLDQLLEMGVSGSRIELDPRCTICDPGLHSYRRDGALSGRMFGVIGMLPAGI
ncbi:MAG: Multi-copper polyphenol oxidoreductase laccase [Chlorobi bacterium]|nr:Multi-copper polyphenol oxidoreductase laccase [Chlorobiota bacterium]